MRIKFFLLFFLSCNALLYSETLVLSIEYEYRSRAIPGMEHSFAARSGEIIIDFISKGFADITIDGEKIKTFYEIDGSGFSHKGVIKDNIVYRFYSNFTRNSYEKFLELLLDERSFMAIGATRDNNFKAFGKVKSGNPPDF